MFYTIIILNLFIFTKILATNNLYCNLDNSGSKCHDGGCGYYKKGSSKEICTCSFSNGVMSGKYCGIYDDKCLDDPCKNNGKCKSGIGHHICECSENFYGISCEFVSAGKLNNK